MNTKNTRLARPLLVLALFGASAFCLNFGTRAQESWSKLPAAFNQDLPERLGPASLLGALGGMRAPAADWSYIDALQYIGDNANFRDNRYGKTYALYREILWLDPYFHFAVLEGCSFLTWFISRPVEGRKLLEEAMRVDQRFSRYRLYYAAMAWSEKNVDHMGMVEILKPELEKPDAPEMLLRAVGNVITRYGKPAEATEYWEKLLLRAREKQTQRLAMAELAKLRNKAP